MGQGEAENGGARSVLSCGDGCFDCLARPALSLSSRQLAGKQGGQAGTNHFGRCAALVAVFSLRLRPDNEKRRGGGRGRGRRKSFLEGSELRASQLGREREEANLAGQPERFLLWRRYAPSCSCSSTGCSFTFGSSSLVWRSPIDACVRCWRVWVLRPSLSADLRVFAVKGAGRVARSCPRRCSELVPVSYDFR
jgi:hypothetical protein